jgi:hypothetical protein
MKKLVAIKKLTLNRETLRQLESTEAELVVGGVTVPVCTNTCRPACTTIRTTCC